MLEGTAESYNVISNNKEGSGNASLHHDSYNKIVPWAASADASQWIFQEATDLTEEEVRTIVGCVEPASGYFRIMNCANSSPLNEDYANHRTYVTSQDAADYTQLWKLTKQTGADNVYIIENVFTGKQLLNTAAWNANYFTGDATNSTFVINLNQHSPTFERIYNIAPDASTTSGLNKAPGGYVCRWSFYDGTNDLNSAWYFEEVNITDEQATAYHQAYVDLLNEQAAGQTAVENIGQFFTDANCTQLKDTYQAMTDDELQTAMREAGITSPTLLSMAVKIKQNSWAAWEQTFRVAQAKPYSDAAKYQSAATNSFLYAQLNNPTGIAVTRDHLAYVWIDQAVPAGATVQAWVVEGTNNSSSSSFDLKQGLNVLSISRTGTLFINYKVNTVDAIDGARRSLADYPTLAYHVEGGDVQGYFDLTKGMTNADWADMKAKGLFTKAFAMQMVGEKIIFNMNANLVKQHVGDEQMEGVVGYYDWLVRTEESLQGVEDMQPYFNNKSGAYSVTYNYMFASNFGTYYEESTLSTILNLAQLQKGGGSLWGPAHETGHMLQNLINIAGDSEVSNNLFSEVVVHENGVTNTRNSGATINGTADQFAQGKCYIDYNSWTRTRMYFQLYLYFHAQKHQPDFYPRLFKSLRADQMDRRKNVEVNAKDNYLKFALKCCEVSGLDLSEFFEAYGMFVPTNGVRTIDDYGTYKINLTQADAEEVKAKMHQYAQPMGNILFIEDHVKLEPKQDHAGNILEGTRTQYGDMDVSLYGEVGNYSDYASGLYASNYAYTVTDEGKVTITDAASGAVGFKVYDAEGHLAYFANTRTFTLPAKLLGTNYVVKVAQADGTDVALPAPSSKCCTLQVYHPDADAPTTLYADGTAPTLPTLTPGSLAFITAADEGLTDEALEAVSAATNVVNAYTNPTAPTAEQVVLTDKVNFVAPQAFTAKQLTYERQNVAGYNSVCLPFPITATDFGVDAEVETLTAHSDDGTQSWLHFTPLTGELPAGTPCLVKCPATAEAWCIQKEQVQFVTAPTPVTIAAGTLHGSFANASIGANHYKLNAAGTTFFPTTEAGRVTAYRVYFTPTAAAAAAARSFEVSHDAACTTSLTDVTTSPALPSTDCYDLNGRRVSTPIRGGIYVIGGKLVVYP